MCVIFRLVRYEAADGEVESMFAGGELPYVEPSNFCGCSGDPGACDVTEHYNDCWSFQNRVMYFYLITIKGVIL